MGENGKGVLYRRWGSFINFPFYYTLFILAELRIIDARDVEQCLLTCKGIAENDIYQLLFMRNKRV